MDQKLFPASSSTTTLTQVSTDLVSTKSPLSLGEEKSKSLTSSSWSLTSVRMYEQCAYKARLRYFDKVKEERSDSASRGVDLHKVVELYLLGKVSTLPEELSHYQSWFDGVKQYEYFPEHKTSLSRDWNPTPWNEGWFRAVLDLKVVKSSEEIVIYDWKTGKIYPDHDDQKSLYSLSQFCEHPTVRSVRAIHVYFDLGKLREKTFHRDQMHFMRESWESRAGKFLEALKRPEEMIPNPGFHCRYCSFSASKGGPCRF